MLPIVLFLCGSVLGQTGKAPADVTYSQLNAALGLPLWTNENLWDQDAAATAKRLRWPLESKTSYDSSYQLYTAPALTVLGEHPYSLWLFGDAEGKVAELSMVFANLGDIDDFLQDPQSRKGKVTTADQTRVTTAVRDTIEKESSHFSAQLTALLGRSTLTAYGPDPKTSETVQRWNWNGHAILLASEKDKYLALRIVPSDVADRKIVQQVNGDALRKQLAQRVVHRANGDVIIQDIPMVDQGPKGYCVPATWARDLRYMGVPADLYQLALAGSTNVGGGTSVSGLARGAENLVRTYGYHLVSRNGSSMQIQNFSEKIDQGLPLMWDMFVIEDLNANLTKRSMLRKANTTPADWEAYKKILYAAGQDAHQLKVNRDNGHMCMIIGYNKKTNELAISDSWGPNFAERWITVDEAQVISKNEFTEINW